MLGGVRPFGPEPVRGPRQRAEKSARGDGRVLGLQRAAPNAFGNQQTDAAFVAISLVDNASAERRRERVHFEVSGGPLHFADNDGHVADSEAAKAVGERRCALAGGRQRRQQPIERLVLAEVEAFFFAAEVVIQVAEREVGGDRNLAHSRCRKPAAPEDAGGGSQDRHATGMCADRTAVRKLNHGSIISPDGAARAG